MGCDIHMYVEKRQADGTWTVVAGRNPRIDDYRKYAESARKRGDEEYALSMVAQADAIESGTGREFSHDEPEMYMEYDAPEVYKDWVWDGRNYDLFAILANVRNGHGFAGIETGMGFKPIAMPRELPPDVSAYVKGRSDSWDCDGHSHSYHALTDLLAYDWHQITFRYGVVSEAEYLTFKEKGSPESWCGDVSGYSVRNISLSQMDDLLAGELRREPDVTYYTRVKWMLAYKNAVGSFYSDAIPKLQALAGDDPTSVRIVFWFDN